MSPLAGMMIPHESYSICWEASRLWFRRFSGRRVGLPDGDAGDLPQVHRGIQSQGIPGDPNRSQVKPHGLVGEGCPRAQLFWGEWILSYYITVILDIR